MAITLISAPSGDFLTTGKKNVLNFIFTASASETWMQLRFNDGTTDYELQPVPFIGGSATIDLCPYLSALLSNDDNTDNSRSQGLNFSEMPFVQFTLEQRNSASGTYAGIGGTYTALNASRQLGESPNLDDYAPTVGTGGIVLAEGAFLTKRTRPKLFWYSDETTPASASDVSVWQQQIGYAVQAFDTSKTKRQLWSKNGVTVHESAGSDAFTDTGVTGISDAETYIYQSDQLTVSLEEASGGDTFASITFDIVRACTNPVAVKWLNTLGVWETYIFEGDAPITPDIQDKGIYDVPVTSLSTATELSRSIGKTRNDEIEVFADNLTYSEAEALQEIYTSPLVLLYVGDVQGGIAFDEWQGVIASGDSDLDKNKVKQSFSCTLRKAEYLTQRS